LINKRKIFLTTIILAIVSITIGIIIIFLHKSKQAQVAVIPTPTSIKVMSYNINHGEDINGGYGLKEIIELIKIEKPDFVLLNDVDNIAIRTYREDQARKIAGNLGMYFTFGKTMEVEEGWNGNAILSKYPIKYSENRFFKKTTEGEAQSMLYAVFIAGEKNIHLVTTELSNDPLVSELQNMEVVDKIVAIMSKFAVNDPLILAGSFKMNYDHISIKGMNNYLGNVTSSDTKADKVTYPGNDPQFQYDYIFYRKNINLISKKVWKDNNTKNASDHLPVIAEFDLR